MKHLINKMQDYWTEYNANKNTGVLCFAKIHANDILQYGFCSDETNSFCQEILDA